VSPGHRRPVRAVEQREGGGFSFDAPGLVEAGNLASARRLAPRLDGTPSTSSDSSRDPGPIDSRFEVVYSRAAKASMT
jgi:hypothetical protein